VAVVVEHRAAAVAEDRVVVVAAVAGVVNQEFILFLVPRKMWKWRGAICGERN
jgi:hypothetical protein